MSSPISEESAAVVDVEGTLSHRNWLAFNDKQPWLGAFEAALYSDATILGGAIIGPYTFMHAFRLDAPRTTEPVMFLIVINGEPNGAW